MFHTVICDMLGIRYPILQGAMQGAGGPDLVAAVSEAGGLGILPTFGGTACVFINDNNLFVYDIVLLFTFYLAIDFNRLLHDFYELVD